MLDEALAQRASVRTFTDQPVEPEAIHEILQAAMAAPSAGNLQPWEFYVVRDADLRAQLAVASPYSAPAGRAPVVVVPCLRTAGARFPECAPLDLAAAVENMLIQVSSLGLGAVWMAAYPHAERAQHVSAALSLPAELTPFALVAIGHPDRPVPAKGPERYDASRVHEL